MCERCASHLAEYDHIALSLKKHGFYSEKNPTGWKLAFKTCPKSELDEREVATIKSFADNGFLRSLRNCWRKENEKQAKRNFIGAVPPGKERRMKPEEAIERLEYLESALDGYPPETGINDVFAAIDTAIEALKEVQQYREIGTVEECREAVEKQKAKDMITARNADRGYCDKEE